MCDVTRWAGDGQSAERPGHGDRTVRDSEGRDPASVVGDSGRTGRTATRLLRRVAFWLAVSLPVLYVPLLLSPGAFDWSVPGFGVGLSAGGVGASLVALHLFAVVLGHDYARRDS